MSQFSIAIALTLKNEGGYVDNPSDPGGPTNMGITQADMPGVNIKDLTVAQAETFYQKNFWNPLYDQIADQSVANKIFDMGVLCGIQEAVQYAQWSTSARLTIEADGVFGPETLAAVNGTDSTIFLETYKAGLVFYALFIVTEHPDEKIFVNGWVNRINS